MLMDCTDRLDPKGYHRLSVTREDTLARWDCTVETKEDDWVEGDAIMAYQRDGNGAVTQELRLKLGDVVYLSGSRKGRPAEIGKIVMFAAQPEVDHIWLKVRWFWRPECLRLPDNLDWHERELFAEDSDKTAYECDENSAAAVELTRVVVLPYDASRAPSTAPHTFFERRKYNHLANEVSELEPDVTPMDDGGGTGTTNGAAPAATPPAAAPAAAPRPAPRRNEQKERIAALEDQVASLLARVASLELAQGVTQGV